MDPLKPLIDNLYAEGRPRVWSLVITVFGDSVQHRGGEIHTSRLNQLLGRIGIGNGALRTALSRLASDGWVIGHKEGRISRYQLTEFGKSEVSAAQSRIYARPDVAQKDWTFCSQPVPNALRVAGGWLTPDTPKASTGSGTGSGFCMTGRVMSHSADTIWQGLDPAHRVALARLAEDLQTLKNLPDVALDASAARTLLIHRWRRTILRWPEIPPEFLPDHFPITDLRQTVAQTYHRLTPQTETWLGSDDNGLIPMPAPDQALSWRFHPSQRA
ncbi:MAG: hypothetical protein N4A61_01560 [Pelagimonas sp.]|jgi:phenylacetic acid degradation operon negative regulatory protein|nr:hypothetical protein [Pelagimonas sp.]